MLISSISLIIGAIFFVLGIFKRPKKKLKINLSIPGGDPIIMPYAYLPYGLIMLSIGVYLILNQSNGILASFILVGGITLALIIYLSNLEPFGGWKEKLISKFKQIMKSKE